jgi:hypothetical protein
MYLRAGDLAHALEGKVLDSTLSTAKKERWESEYEPGVVMHICKLNTQEDEIGCRVLGLMPEL